MQSLELDQSQLTTLPESFGKLAALQTLRDVGLGRLRRSPDGVRASPSNHTLYIACAEALVAGSWAWIHLILLRSCSLVQEIAARCDGATLGHVRSSSQRTGATCDDCRFDA